MALIKSCLKSISAIPTDFVLFKNAISGSDVNNEILVTLADIKAAGFSGVKVTITSGSPVLRYKLDSASWTNISSGDLIDFSAMTGTTLDINVLGSNVQYQIEFQ